MAAEEAAEAAGGFRRADTRLKPGANETGRAEVPPAHEMCRWAGCLFPCGRIVEATGIPGWRGHDICITGNPLWIIFTLRAIWGLTAVE